MINKEYAQKILEKIKTPAAYEYFFDNLQSAEWIDPLKSVQPNIFKKPIPAEKTESGWIFPWWPESRYLARVADQAPDKVERLIKDLDRTNNSRVHEDFADAILKMPLKNTKSLIPIVLQWLESDYLFQLPKKLASFSLKLAKGGDCQSSLKLIDKVLDLKAYAVNKEQDILGREFKVSTRYSDFSYFEILKEDIPLILETCGFEVLKLLRKKLMFVISTEKYEGERDFSSIWRRQIDHTTDYESDTLIHQLIDSFRDSYQFFLEKSKSYEVEALIKELLDSRQGILIRIGLFFLSQPSFIKSKLASDVVREAKYYDSADLWHEFSNLLENKFPMLEQNEKEDVENLIFNFKFITGEGEEKVEITETEKLRFYSQISADLSPSANEAFKILEAKYGMLENSKFHSAAPEVFFGPTSPVEQDKLQTMNTQEIFSLLLTWTPSKEWASPSIDGLARVLQEVVKDNPMKILNGVENISRLRLTYVTHILNGLSASKESFDWSLLLNVLEWVVSQPLPSTDTDSAQNLELRWARMEVARILHKSLDSSKINFVLRSRVWELLHKLTNDPHPSSSDEDSFTDFDDPYHLAINSVRGLALESVISYGLWIKRELKIPDSDNVFLNAPEAKGVLDRHLDISIDPQLSTRSIYGRWIPWLILLDEKWVKEKIKTIFPSDPGLEKHRTAVWDTYVLYCGVFDKVFNVLFEEYQYQVKSLAERNRDGKTSSHDPDRRICEHIMLLYGRGKIDLNNDSLVVSFFTHAPEKVREHAISFIGRSLKNDKNPVPPKVIKRFQLLWEWRKSLPLGDVKSELAEFGWWAISEKFESKWALDELNYVLRTVEWLDGGYFLFDWLKKHSETYPDIVLSILHSYIDGPVRKGKLYISKEKLLPLLLSLKSKLPHELRNKYSDLIDLLFNAGFREYKELAKF